MASISISVSGSVSSINVDGVQYVPAGGQQPPGGGGGEPPPGGGGGDGGSGGGGSGLPPVTGGSITTKPTEFAQLGTNAGRPAERQVSANEVVGVGIEVVAGSYGRNLQWFGAPGEFFDYSNWAIFDASGVKVMGDDNSLYEKAQETHNLGLLPPGHYTFAVSVDKPGNLAIQWQQGVI
jgi:hypothetical protein